YSFGLINNDTGVYDYTSEIFKCNFYEDDGRVNLISYFDNLIADGDYYANNGKNLFYIYIKIPGIKIPVIKDADDNVIYTFPSIEIYDLTSAEERWYKETAAALTDETMTEQEKAYIFRDYIKNNFDYQYHDDNGTVYLLNDLDFIVFMHNSMDCWVASAVFCKLLNEVGIKAEGIFNDPDNEWHKNTLITYSDGTTEILCAQPSTLKGSLTKHDTYYEFDYKTDENGNKLRIDFVDPITAPAYVYTGDGVY
ncbi:MAG: hypothetical protein K6B41_03260, partial [Butyrivibrio sp.]|nr:hypothetical protein [Butyrivibrio sp.]